MNRVRNADINSDELVIMDALLHGDKIDALKRAPGITFISTIQQQLFDLLATRSPSFPLTDSAFHEALPSVLQDRTLDTYGQFLYYPWSKRLLQVLPENEFIELRTNRNKNKITHEEQSLLHTKTISVIGLSVGQSVAMTLAMERICGTLMLADFDRLDLSNLNRIRTGLHNLGELKTHIVKREILELDPYLKVHTFDDGLHDENIDEIISQSDIVVDECDSMEMKIKLRKAAKLYKKPVVMDTSDRGQLDIERFDLNPDMPIFHGNLEDLDLDNLEINKPEIKMGIMQRIIDFKSASPRALQSFMEIGKSLKTWPQLASSVTLGGAVGADICRRILLNESHASGRFYIDLNQLIS